MKLYSIENVRYEKAFGMVTGSVIKGKFFVKDWLAGIRKLLGKELVEYTDLMNESRKIAIQRMTKEAEALGADAIIGVRFMTADIASEAAEIMVYGTAVKTKGGE